MKGLRCRKERDHNWQMNSPGTGRQCWLMNDITKRFRCLSRARNCPCRHYESSLGWTTLMLQEAHSAIHMLKEGMQIANIRKSLSAHLLPFFYTTETHFQAVYSSWFRSPLCRRSRYRKSILIQNSSRHACHFVLLS